MMVMACNDGDDDDDADACSNNNSSDKYTNDHECQPWIRSCIFKRITTLGQSEYVCK